jgi:hypothetical protein
MAITGANVIVSPVGPLPSSRIGGGSDERIQRALAAARSSSQQLARELARELASKAARNLSRSGRVVTRSATTGRHVIGDRGSGTPSRPTKD